jgi:hypothetical protein
MADSLDRGRGDLVVQTFLSKPAIKSRADILLIRGDIAGQHGFDAFAEKLLAKLGIARDAGAETSL